MAIELAVLETTGSTNATQVSSLLSTTGTAALTFKLLSDADPATDPVNVATLHLSDAEPSTTAGFFLTPNAPTLDITCDPADLWLSVHGDDEFVQIISVQ